MKWIKFLLVLAISVQVKAQPQEVEIKIMPDHYFFGDASKLKEGVNCYVLTNRKEYNRMFGQTNRVDTPFFEKEWMLVIMMPKGNWHNKLDYRKISMKAGHTIEVYCKVEMSNKKLPYEFYPLKACVIPKFKGVTKIKFYNERHMQRLAFIDIN